MVGRSIRFSPRQDSSGICCQQTRMRRWCGVKFDRRDGLCWCRGWKCGGRRRSRKTESLPKLWAGMLRIRRSSGARRYHMRCKIGLSSDAALLANPVTSCRQLVRSCDCSDWYCYVVKQLRLNCLSQSFYIQSGVILPLSSNLSLAAAFSRNLSTLTRPISCPKLHLLHSLFQLCITIASLSDAQHPLALANDLSGLDCA
jgi:hypothetical protein